MTASFEGFVECAMLVMAGEAAKGQMATGCRVCRVDVTIGGHRPRQSPVEPGVEAGFCR